MSDDHQAAYRAYLERFDRLVGPRPVGQYGTWKKHLVKKFAPDEFSQRHDKYLKLQQVCHHILETGATMNDTVTLALDEAAAEIVIESVAETLSPLRD
jgi:hypothetical protein